MQRPDVSQPDVDRIMSVLEHIGADASLIGSDGVLRLDVGDRSIVVAVHDGAVEAQRGHGVADLVAAFDETDFTEIALGQRNALCAAMQGRVRLSGDLGRLGVMGRVLVVLSEHLQHDPEGTEGHSRS